MAKVMFQESAHVPSLPQIAGRTREAREARAALVRETRLIREAVALVAAGASPRVVVAGIRHGETLLDVARRVALESGVRVNPIRRADGAGVDIAVEPIYE